MWRTHRADHSLHVHRSVHSINTGLHRSTHISLTPPLSSFMQHSVVCVCSPALHTPCYIILSLAQLYSISSSERADDLFLSQWISPFRANLSVSDASPGFDNSCRFKSPVNTDCHLQSSLRSADETPQTIITQPTCVIIKRCRLQWG